VDNAVDEFVMGAGHQVDVTVDYETGAMSVRDYGRGDFCRDCGRRRRVARRA